MQYLDFTIKTASQAGQLLLKNFAAVTPDVRKAGKLVKTRYDLVADRFIQAAIKKSYPKHSIFSEESKNVDRDKDFLWVVDPLDGTANYVNGNPFFAVSLALWVKNEPLVGIIEAPAIGERYVAVKSQGAWLTNLRTGQVKKVKVSTTKNLADAYMLSCEGGYVNRDKTFQMVKQFYSSVRDFRKLGSAAIELGYVGAGRSDLYAAPQFYLWDIGAGVLFVKEAGGRLFDFRGQEYSWAKLATKKDRSRLDLVAANKTLKIPKILFRK